MNVSFFSLFKGSTVIMEILVKSSIVLGITLFACFLSRKRSASFRHSLLVTAMVILFLLPFVVAISPGWHSTIIPDFYSFTTNPSANVPAPAIPGETSLSLDTVEFVEESPLLPQDGAKTKDFSFASLLDGVLAYGPAMLWSCGLLFFMIQLAFGLYGTSRLTTNSISVNSAPWKDLFYSFASLVSLAPSRRNIRLLKNSKVLLPMTWGVRRPVILLPGNSDGWSLEQCSAVLFHELSHVKRWDFPVRVFSRVICALYWFHPLSWVLFRQLKKEQEKACDAMVLKAGIKPSTYASCLLQLKQSIEKEKMKGPGVPVTATVIGMAGQSEFKERLTTILEKSIHLKQTEVKMKTKIMLLVIGIVIAALVGTAKPAAALGAQGNAALLAASDSAVVQDTATTADEKKEEKKVIKKKACGEEKDLDIWVSIDKDGKDEKGDIKKMKLMITEKGADGKEEKVLKKMIFLPDSEEFDRVEVEGDDVVLYKGDKVVKKIAVDRTGKDKEGHKFIKKEIVKCKGDAKKEKVKEINVVISGDDEKIKTAEENVFVIKKAEGEDEEGKHLVFIEEDKGKEGEPKVFSIRTKIREDKTVEKNMKVLEKGLQNLDKELAKKSPAQAKAIQDMEAALKEMQKALQKREENLKHITIDMDKEGLHEIKEIAIEHKDAGKLKWVGKEGHIFTSLGDTKADIHMEIASSAAIDKKQEKKIKKAVAALEKKLPKNYKVKSAIAKEKQAVTIDCPAGPDEQSRKKAFADIEKFEKELKDILPAEGKKITKKIKVEKKEKK